MNRKGEKPESLEEDGKAKVPAGPIDLATQENIARFDRAKKKKKKKKPSAAKQDQPKAAPVPHVQREKSQKPTNK